MVKKYIKKPMPIEAVQYTGNNIDEVQDFCVNSFIEDGMLHVNTREGMMVAPHRVGDYVVKDTDKSFFICDKHMFKEMYEEVNDRKCTCTCAFY